MLGLFQSKCLMTRLRSFEYYIGRGLTECYFLQQKTYRKKKHTQPITKAFSTAFLWTLVTKVKTLIVKRILYRAYLVIMLKFLDLGSEQLSYQGFKSAPRFYDNLSMALVVYFDIFLGLLAISFENKRNQTDSLTSIQY